MDWLLPELQKAVAAGSLWVYVLAFAGGLFASVTPCTYPVLPLTVGFIGSSAGGSRGKAFALSLVMVTGMAAVYAALGVALAVLRLPFGSLSGNGLVLFGLACFFILLALLMLEALPFPDFFARLAGGAGPRKGYAGAFMTGAASGLLVGPCTGPILGVVLGAVAATLDRAAGAGLFWAALDGGAKLFLFGFGQGALILACGTFAGLLARLPRSGAWLKTFQKGFALLILAGAALLLVHVGQTTDFPRLARWFAPERSAPPPAGPAERPPSSGFGGDEFLR